MKNVAVLLGIAGLLLAGCGKTSEQKHLEGELWAKVKALHDEAMTQIMEFGDLEQKIDEAIALHDDLAKRYPRQMKDHTADDLQAARAGLEEVREKMDNWMKGFKPYDESLPHADAIASLEASQKWLAGATAEIGSAVTRAKEVLEEHRVAAEEITKKSKKR